MCKDTEQPQSNLSQQMKAAHGEVESWDKGKQDAMRSAMESSRLERLAQTLHDAEVEGIPGPSDPPVMSHNFPKDDRARYLRMAAEALKQIDTEQPITAQEALEAIRKIDNAVIGLVGEKYDSWILPARQRLSTIRNYIEQAARCHEDAERHRFMRSFSGDLNEDEFDRIFGDLPNPESPEDYDRLIDKARQQGKENK